MTREAHRNEFNASKRAAKQANASSLAAKARNDRLTLRNDVRGSALR
jgi:hypothetical protein